MQAGNGWKATFEISMTIYKIDFTLLNPYNIISRIKMVKNVYN